MSTTDFSSVSAAPHAFVQCFCCGLCIGIVTLRMTTASPPVTTLARLPAVPRWLMPWHRQCTGGLPKSWHRQIPRMYSHQPIFWQGTHCISGDDCSEQAAPLQSTDLTGTVIQAHGGWICPPEPTVPRPDAGDECRWMAGLSVATRPLAMAGERLEHVGWLQVLCACLVTLYRDSSIPLRKVLRRR